MKNFFLLICIFILTATIASSEIVTLSDGTKIDLKSDGTYVVISNKETDKCIYYHFAFWVECCTCIANVHT